VSYLESLLQYKRFASSCSTEHLVAVGCNPLSFLQ